MQNVQVAELCGCNVPRVSICAHGQLYLSGITFVNAFGAGAGDRLWASRTYQATTAASSHGSVAAAASVELVHLPVLPLRRKPTQECPRRPTTDDEIPNGLRCNGQRLLRGKPQRWIGLILQHAQRVASRRNIGHAKLPAGYIHKSPGHGDSIAISVQAQSCPGLRDETGKLSIDIEGRFSRVPEVCVSLSARRQMQNQGRGQRVHVEIRDRLHPAMIAVRVRSVA